MNTLADSLKAYKPVIVLTRILSRKTLSLLRTIFFIGFVLCGIITITINQFEFTIYTPELLGFSFIFLSLWLEQVLIYAYHNNYYFQGLESVIGLSDETPRVTTYEVAKVVLAKPDDVTKAFCTSTFGLTVLIRSGISGETIDTFINNPRQKITADMVVLPTDEVFSLIGLGKYLLSHDSGFKEIFSQQGIPEEHFIGSLRWIIGTYHQQKRTERWWSKDNLSKTKSIGREWTYGTAFELERYARPISTSAVFSTISRDSAFATEKIAEMESALVRAKSANVLLIGEPGVGKIDLVMEMQRRMETGRSLASIVGSHIVVLDTTRLFASHHSKEDLEVTLLNLFGGAIEAGNTIIVIENISLFIKEAEAMGVFIPELLDEFLASSALRIIGTDTPGAFHNVLEPLGGFSRRFAEILIDSPDLFATTRLLQGVALANEIRYQIIFTYAGLVAITVAADRYIVEGVMPDKAIELLVAVASKAKQENQVLIDADFVYEVVSEKTGVPAGPIDSKERDLLLHLEDELHKQVVGQAQALGAIARTMRRSRAGIQATDKPIGSFLFLGPTGVGKTETAKALANVFFGGEGKMQRLDMSEYSGTGALAHLIGDGQQAGTLSNILREHPYTVLLLDEFEKASQAVHDLFLQILDEGVFTDATGKKVNARNTIIIATSNAGSQLILRTVQQRKELAYLSAEIIDSIVREGLFRPELINRFDSTIIFEPLNIEEQGQVASLQLNILYARVKEQGYELTVTKDLMNILVEKGYNPEYGARPMQRVLQDVIEEKIAQKIIGGSIQKGDTIVLTRGDFTEEELAV